MLPAMPVFSIVVPASHERGPQYAEQVLSADVRRTLTGFFAEAPGFLRALVADPVLPD